ncbi:hypothetical protein L218DRAFT_999129 [Marasmius fiardii PR-910]|nr:hypothetical protein L218DRAFT_999129 [Marasmius fiardii PR-910]
MPVFLSAEPAPQSLSSDPPSDPNDHDYIYASPGLAQCFQDHTPAQRAVIFRRFCEAARVRCGQRSVMGFRCVITWVKGTKQGDVQCAHIMPRSTKTEVLICLEFAWDFVLARKSPMKDFNDKVWNYRLCNVNFSKSRCVIHRQRIDRTKPVKKWHLWKDIDDTIPIRLDSQNPMRLTMHAHPFFVTVDVGLKLDNMEAAPEGSKKKQRYHELMKDPDIRKVSRIWKHWSKPPPSWFTKKDSHAGSQAPSRRSQRAANRSARSAALSVPSNTPLEATAVEISSQPPTGASELPPQNSGCDARIEANAELEIETSLDPDDLGPYTSEEDVEDDLIIPPNFRHDSGQGGGLPGDEEDEDNVFNTPSRGSRPPPSDLDSDVSLQFKLPDLSRFRGTHSDSGDFGPGPSRNSTLSSGVAQSQAKNGKHRKDEGNTSGGLGSSKLETGKSLALSKGKGREKPLGLEMASPIVSPHSGEPISIFDGFLTSEREDTFRETRPERNGSPYGEDSLLNTQRIADSIMPGPSSRPMCPVPAHKRHQTSTKFTTDDASHSSRDRPAKTAVATSGSTRLPSIRFWEHSTSSAVGESGTLPSRSSRGSAQPVSRNAAVQSRPSGIPRLIHPTSRSTTARSTSGSAHDTPKSDWTRNSSQMTPPTHDRLKKKH